MDLKQLAYFLEIGRSSSMSRAASRVWITQPALSRQIKALEEELGVRLFERGPRGMALTSVGELLHARATKILQDVAEMRQEVRSYEAEPSGLLTLAISPSLHASVTAPAAVRFRERFPAATLRIREGTSLASRDLLQVGEADIALLAAQKSDELRTEPLAIEDIYLVSRQEGRPHWGDEVEIGELASLSLILTPPPNTLRAIIDAALAGGRGSARPIMEAETSSLIASLLKEGRDFSVMPRSASADVVREHGFNAWRLKGLTIAWQIATPKDTVQSIGVVRFSELLREIAGGLIAQGVWRASHDGANAPLRPGRG